MKEVPKINEPGIKDVSKETMTYDGGAGKYTGQWKDGKAHGRGVFVRDSDNHREEGFWKNGSISGKRRSMTHNGAYAMQGEHFVLGWQNGSKSLTSFPQASVTTQMEESTTSKERI